MRNALAVLALAGLALLGWALWDHAAPWGLDGVVAWMRHARPVPYFAVTALLFTVGAPITPFFIAAGAAFGVRVGLVGSLLALASSLSLNYWIARGRLRPWLESLLRRSGRELPDLGEAGKHAVRFTVMVKLAPGIPAFLKSFVLAVAGVPFALYLALSMLITGTYAAALVVLGESLFEHDLTRALVPVAIVVVVAALGLWWRRRRRDRDGSRGEARASDTTDQPRPV
jgi:uncharacterized membrane protein YdjX (TVP38/TMEM64 family)